MGILRIKFTPIGVSCEECCVGQTPECGRCWDFCEGGKVGKFVLPGPISKLGKTFNGTEGSLITSENLKNFEPESLKPMKVSGPSMNVSVDVHIDGDTD